MTKVYRRSVTTSSFILPLTLLLFFGACSSNYPKLMHSTVKRTIGDRGNYGNLPTKAYTWFAYPTDNFGVGTMFVLGNRTELPSEANQRCAMWSCLDTARPTDITLLRNFNNFADVGLNGGEITLSEKTKISIGNELVLPQVYQLVGVGTKGKASKTTTMTLRLGRIYPRVLIRSKIEDFLRGLPGTDARKIAFAQGNLAIAVADYMIESMEADIQVDRQIDQSLDLALANAARANAVLAPVVGSGAKLGLSVSASGNGAYHLTIANPVIIATYIKLQPTSGVLAAPDDAQKWLDWVVTKPAVAARVAVPTK